MSSNKTFNNTANSDSDDADQAFLDKLFDEECDINEFEENKVALIDPPAHLTKKLYTIAEQDQTGTTKSTSAHLKVKWLAPLASAACFIVVLLFGYHSINEYKDRQVALKAQQDLIIAFAYLEKANQKANETLSKTLAENISKATIKPLLESTLLLNEAS